MLEVGIVDLLGSLTVLMLLFRWNLGPEDP